MGGPGSGKSATCELIREGFGFVIISTGQVLKHEVASGSATGECGFQSSPLVSSVDLVRSSPLVSSVDLVGSSPPVSSVILHLLHSFRV
jgi:adenylate kinase family enzyme